MWRRIKEESPSCVIGSPPCTMFSVLQAMNPAVRGEDPEAAEKFRQELGKARKHVEFCCIIYKMQLAGGRHFLHEHPWGGKILGHEVHTGTGGGQESDDLEGRLMPVLLGDYRRARKDGAISQENGIHDKQLDRRGGIAEDMRRQGSCA